jgi:hypothetical protein
MRKMKLFSVVQLRVPIMAVVATIAIAGLIHFYQQFLLHPSYGGRALTGFLMLSLLGIALIVPYLWSDWLQRRQIKYFEVALVVVLGPAAVLRFNQGKIFQAVLDGTIALVGLLAILPRLLGPKKMRARETVHKTAEDAGNEQKPFAIRETGGRYFGMLLIWLIAMEMSFSHIKGHIPFWYRAAFVLPALWLAWESIFQFSKGIRDLRSAKATIRDVNDKGGRA